MLFRSQTMMWVSDPFNSKLPETLKEDELEELIDLSTDSSPFTSKLEFHSLSFLEFWCEAGNEHKQLGMKALRVLVPFATSYLCEAGFSAVAV